MPIDLVHHTIVISFIVMWAIVGRIVVASPRSW